MIRALQPHEGELYPAVREELRPGVPKGPVWIRCDPSVPHVELRRALREVPAYQGVRLRDEVPTVVILCADAEGDCVSALDVLAEDAPGVPVVVFGASANLPLARAALRAGTRGFLHAHMLPEHLARALRLAEEGEVVLPRDLLSPAVKEARGPDLSMLTARQMEILELVSKGLANAQVARRLYLSEPTIKQHLHAAYKALGVRNRAAAGALFRRCKSA